MDIDEFTIHTLHFMCCLLVLVFSEFKSVQCHPPIPFNIFIADGDLYNFLIFLHIFCSFTGEGVRVCVLNVWMGENQR
jgi:hypothetical protein